MKTLIYADLFDYPLTKEEIWRRLIKLQITNDKLQIKLKKLINSILFGKKEKYYYLVGREEIIQLRKRREKYSEEKVKIARRIAKLLKFIPFVKLVGLTGAVAAGNADEDDDIDLLIITSGNLLWTTRLLVTLSVDLMGLRRRPDDKKVKNKICLNMFIDENYLAIGKDERDLFTAYEITQMKPLFEKNQIYKRFIKANDWVGKYLPNAFNELSTCPIVIPTDHKRVNHLWEWRDLPYSGSWKIPPRWPSGLGMTLFRLLEIPSKRLQLIYMKKRRTTEKIKTGVIRFHPRDIRKEIMKRFETRAKSPLDKVFFTE